MIERLYYHDSYLWAFEAAVISRSEDGTRIELDRTAFYPSSGGQPFDTGKIEGIKVVDVTEEGDRIIHVLNSPLSVDQRRVSGMVDSSRRLDHMRQHTGQHLLSAVMDEEFDLKTVGFHMGVDYSTIDVEPQNVSPATLASIEQRANARLIENATVSVSYEHSHVAAGLRKNPERTGLLRIVTIASIDRSACGGTHVHRTGEVGMILLGKTEKVRKALRLEFFCGDRVRREIHRRLHEAEEQNDALRERLVESDKTRKRLASEVAEFAGQQRFARSVPDGQGRHVWVEELEEMDEDARLRATSFLNNENTFVILSGRNGASVMFGAHSSLGLDCGKALKEALVELGGKGGGSTKLAQGSLPDMEKARQLVQRLKS